YRSAQTNLPSDARPNPPAVHAANESSELGAAVSMPRKPYGRLCTNSVGEYADGARNTQPRPTTSSDTPVTPIPRLEVLNHAPADTPIATTPPMTAPQSRVV